MRIILPFSHIMAYGRYLRTSYAFVFCALLYSMVLPVWAKTPGTALDWIKRMNQAEHNANYSQVFIYENQSGISTIKRFHAHLNGHEYERLFFLNGPHREFISKDGRIAKVHGEKAEKLLNVPMPKALPFTQLSEQSFKNMQQFYQFEENGNDRIAGHNCVKIIVKPKDSFRYGYKLWIDKKTGLLLRVDLQNENQLTLDRFMVTQMQIMNTLTIKDFPWPAQSTKATKAPVPNLQSAITTLPPRLFPWNISWLPAGFSPVGANTTKSPINGESVNYILYSDGLSAFSVYVEKDISQILSQSADKFGATSAVSRVFKTGKNAYYNVTVIGELPLGAAERIAVSVNKRHPTGDHESVKK